MSRPLLAQAVCHCRTRPRAGYERAVLEGIAPLQPRQIIYVSCDLSTLARDLKRLVQRGYELKHVRPLDLFPQTYHIESVTLLARPQAV
jgi:23S rRNA (uracil1939-C5)-methyltransferase